MVELAALCSGGSSPCVCVPQVLAAPRDGIVKEILASAGATLSADQAILSFEDVTPRA